MNPSFETLDFHKLEESFKLYRREIQEKGFLKGLGTLNESPTDIYDMLAGYLAGATSIWAEEEIAWKVACNIMQRERRKERENETVLAMLCSVFGIL